MKALSMPKKFLSIRDKNGNHHKSRPMTSGDWFAIFKTEAAKQAEQAEKHKEEEERENAKIADISRRLAELGHTELSDLHIRYALNSKYAEGDADRALELVRLQQKAFAGVVEPYNPNVKMVGAENRGNVTCYLDALLFAMFAKLESFESMLKHDSTMTDERARKLAALIRLWVNMIRTGRMIHTDLTQHIQEALSSCGWQDAELLEQQDTSEAFAFITETLQLPLLTLQVDLFHHGKRDNDDHKVVYERLLNLAVPPDPEGKGIKLEDCLEEYFNTKVDVLRDSLEEKAPPTPILRLEVDTRMLTVEEHGEAADKVASPLQVENTPLQSLLEAAESAEATASKTRPLPRHRATSIIQRVVLDEQGKPTGSSDSPTFLQKARRTGSTVVKAVTIPAWQFFRLIPWHATTNNEPQSDMEVARHFKERPVVGICLKRYMMTNQGVPIRQNTFIDIPDSLRLPHFMMVDDMKVEQESLSAEYKLVLQSVVCHRGDSLHSGHYVTFARVAPKLLTDNRRHDPDPPPDYEEAQWVKFDDLCLEERVSYVDDIRVALREEMPYLLFYQIVPVVDVTNASTDGSVNEPPAYDLSAMTTENVSHSPPLDAVDALEAMSRSTSGYFDTLGPSSRPSVRPSMEEDEGRPVRLSFDEDPYSSTSLLKPGQSRRGSITFSEAYTGTPAVTPDSHSPRIAPTDEITGTRLARGMERFTKKDKKKDTKSRPSSQAGEGRISITMSRLSGLVRPSKEPLREDAAGEEDGVLVEANGGEEVNGNGKGKEKEHHHHHHHHHRKERGKSRLRGKDREKDGEKDGEKEAEAERECVVM